MKLSPSVLVSVLLFCFFTTAAVVAATTPDETSGPERPRRRLSSKGNSGGGGTNAETPATPAPTAPTRELAVQGPAPEWTIARQPSTGIYTLSARVGTETVLFSERPDRTARTIATQAFVKQFPDIFDTSNPNAAITFTSTTATADNNNGPLIVELTGARVLGDFGDFIEYTMTQSESQAAVAPIDQFLEISGSCSIFIDSLSMLGIAGGVWQESSLLGFVSIV